MASKEEEEINEELSGIKVEYENLRSQLYKLENRLCKENGGEFGLSTRLQLQASKLFNTDKFSDVQVILKGGTHIKAHKMILAASGDDWGIEQFDHVDMLDLTDLRYDVGYSLIQWVYTDDFGDSVHLDDNFFIEMIHAAQVCKLQALHIRCQKALSTMVNQETCERLLKLSEELDAKILKNNCEKLISNKKEVGKINKSVVDVFDDDYYANEEDDDEDDDDDDYFGDRAMKYDIHPDSNDGTMKDVDAGNSTDIGKDAGQPDTPDQIIKLEVDDVTFEENPCINEIIPAIEIPSAESKASDTGSSAIHTALSGTDIAVSREATFEVSGAICSIDPASITCSASLAAPNRNTVSSTSTDNVSAVLDQSDDHDFTRTRERLVPGSSVNDPQLVQNPHNDNKIDHAYTSPQKNSNTMKAISLKAIINPPNIRPPPKSIQLIANPVKKTENYIDKLRNIINAPEENTPPPQPVSYIFKTFPPTLYIDQPVITFQSNSLNTGPMTLRSASQVKTEPSGIKTKPVNESNTNNCPKKEYKCDVCDKVFTGWTAWKRHTTKLFKGMHWKCDLCQKVFRTLHASKKDNHGCLLSVKDKVYKCEICDKVFKTGRIWRDHHKNVHLGLPPNRNKKKPTLVRDPNNKPQKVHICDVCGKKLKDATSLKRHKNINFPNMHYTCKKCNKSFHNLHDSQTENHGCGLHVKGRIWHCDICNVNFKCGKSLRSHHKSKHLNLKPFQCDICGKSFKSVAFRYHMSRHHAKAKDITCHICGKAYAIDRDLKIHIKSAHENPNQFCCEVCHYTSRSRNAVVVHMRTHTGEKPYSCDVCGKSFATKCTLERHTPIHTGSRPFECDECGKTFPYKAALSKHKRFNHSDQPRQRYGCELCSETFSSRFIVKRHYKRKHSKELSESREATDNVVLEHVDDVEFIDALNFHANLPTENPEEAELYLK